MLDLLEDSVQDLHFPSSSNFSISPLLHTTSYRVSWKHLHCIFLSCTCGWHCFTTLMEYQFSREDQMLATTSIQESHFYNHHLHPYMERQCKKSLRAISSLQQNRPDSEHSVIQPLRPKNTAVTLSALLAHPSSATSEKPQPIFSHPSTMDVSPSKSGKSKPLQSLPIASSS